MDEIEKVINEFVDKFELFDDEYYSDDFKSDLKQLVELVENEQAILCADSQMEWYPNINNRSKRVSEQIDWEEL